MPAGAGDALAALATFPFATDHLQCGYKIRAADDESTSIALSRVCDDGRFTIFMFAPDGDLPMVYQVVTVEAKPVDMVVNTHYSPETGHLVAETLNSTWHVRLGRVLVKIIRPPTPDTRPLPPPLPTGGTLNTDRYVPAFLQTPVDIRSSAWITAIVGQDVYSWGGRTVVVPMGSKAIGFYQKPGDPCVDGPLKSRAFAR